VQYIAEKVICSKAVLFYGFRITTISMLQPDNPKKIPHFQLNASVKVMVKYQR